MKTYMSITKSKIEKKKEDNNTFNTVDKILTKPQI